MLIFPAIDIKAGECVRLRKGEFSTAQKVAADPLQTARSFRTAGARWLHTVDLDAAVAGKPANSGIFIALARDSGLQVQLGGGIRTLEDAGTYLSQGISRVVFGSAAIEDPFTVAAAIHEFGPERVAVGIDAKAGKVAADGWTRVSAIDYIKLAGVMEKLGVRYLIFTDIDRDGMLSGPCLERLKKLKKAVSCHIIASGGVSSLKDIKALRDAGMFGAICGKSLYSGTLSLREAVREAQQEQPDNTG